LWFEARLRGAEGRFSMLLRRSTSCEVVWGTGRRVVGWRIFAETLDEVFAVAVVSCWA
jgi:hypothetical protein